MLQRRGKKVLVLDPRISGFLGQLAEVSLLKEHGVEQCASLASYHPACAHACRLTCLFLWHDRCFTILPEPRWSWLGRGFCCSLRPVWRSAARTPQAAAPGEGAAGGAGGEERGVPGARAHRERAADRRADQGQQQVRPAAPWLLAWPLLYGVSGQGDQPCTQQSPGLPNM